MWSTAWGQAVVKSWSKRFSGSILILLFCAVWAFSIIQTHIKSSLLFFLNHVESRRVSDWCSSKLRPDDPAEVLSPHSGQASQLISGTAWRRRHTAIKLCSVRPARPDPDPWLHSGSVLTLMCCGRQEVTHAEELWSTTVCECVTVTDKWTGG